MVKAKDPIGNGGTGQAESRISSHAEERSSSQIKADIEQTRAQMDRTVNALSEQLNPRHLLDDVLDFFRSGELREDARRFAGRAARKAFEQIKEHPVPSALAGAGLAYLIFLEGSKASRRREERLIHEEELPSESELAYAEIEADVYGCPEPAGASPDVTSYVSGQSSETEPGLEEESGPGMAERAREKVAEAAASMKETAGSAAEKAIRRAKESSSGATEKVKRTASDAAGKVKHSAAVASEKMREVASSTAHKMSDMAGKASAKAAELAASTSEKARRIGSDLRGGAVEAGHKVGDQVRRGYDYGRDRAAEISDEYPLAAGAALMGLGMLLGLALPRTRREDKMIGAKSDQLKHRAKHLVDRGIHAAQATAEQAIDEAKQQGLTPSAVTEKAKHVISDLKGTVADKLQQEEMAPQQVADKAKTIAEHAKEKAQQEFQQQSNLHETKI